MQARHSPQSHSAITSIVGVSLGGLLLASLFFAPQLAFGTDVYWTGATNTTWSTSTNWNGGVPGGPDNAVFNNNFTSNNQPTLTGSAVVGGLWLATGAGRNVTISGSGNILTLNGNTINGTAGLGILLNNTDAYTLTIGCDVKVGNAQTWLNNSNNLLTVSGTVNTNKNALTIGGSGNTTISGVVTSSLGSIIKSGTGALTLSNVGSPGTELEFAL